MNKLVDLLNEYDSNWGFTDYWALFNSMNEWISGTEDLQVISKKFWFIKWLVDNDKIDFDKFFQNQWDWVIDNIEDVNPIKDFEYYQLLMILSVQDNPIEFLIGILK